MFVKPTFKKNFWPYQNLYLKGNHRYRWAFMTNDSCSMMQDVSIALIMEMFYTGKNGQEKRER